MENYFKQLMGEGSILLLQDNVNWPGELSDANKVDLLQKAIKYYEGLEEYEKCALLQKKIELIFNPPKRRGRPKGSKNKK
jgi:hypothetical protein